MTWNKCLNGGLRLLSGITKFFERICIIKKVSAIRSDTTTWNTLLFFYSYCVLFYQQFLIALSESLNFSFEVTQVNVNTPKTRKRWKKSQIFKNVLRPKIYIFHGVWRRFKHKPLSYGYSVTTIVQCQKTIILRQSKWEQVFTLTFFIACVPRSKEKCCTESFRLLQKKKLYWISSNR